MEKNIFLLFVLFSNLIGLIPYSFTITSHLIITFTLSFSIFVGINIICIQKHKLHMLSLFIPLNTSFGLALLLVPIELLSYIFKSISLGVRFFKFKLKRVRCLAAGSFHQMIIFFVFLLFFRVCIGFYTKDMIIGFWSTSWQKALFFYSKHELGRYWVSCF
jgi:hypothetical protein